jgi:hypothetical protein
MLTSGDTPPYSDTQNMFDDLLHDDSRIHRASWWQLIYQGLYLHYASLWGPLRASANFRNNNRDWFKQIIDRWVKEYGLNLMVIILILAVAYTYQGHITITHLIVSTLTPPLLTITQMFIDNYTRGNTIVLYDRASNSGLTLRKVDEHTYAFYNHFALPIGDKNGTYIRAWLHQKMRNKKSNLQCVAQNTVIADYYLNEHQNGVSKGGKRPLLAWEYSGRPTTPPAPTNVFRRLIGLDSIRNSGQIPLELAIG